jgi:hypothetical protein
MSVRFLQGLFSKIVGICYRPEYNMWEVFRYENAQQVLLDPAQNSQIEFTET